MPDRIGSPQVALLRNGCPLLSTQAKFSAVSAEQKYRVSEAILVRKVHGSAWTITFTPLPPPPGAPFDPDWAKDVVVTVSPTTERKMSFQKLYTREQIDALTVDR
jgi:hypothetical protein